MMYDLEELKDDIDNIVFEEYPQLFTEEYAVEFVETALHLMDEYIQDNPHIISEPNFQNILLEEIKNILSIQFEPYIETIYNFEDSEDIEDEINELLEDAFVIFITIFHPDKLSQEFLSQEFLSQDILNQDKLSQENKYNNEEIMLIEGKIQYLREIPQPTQRTTEWYDFRWNLITASNAWKAFENQTIKNQLIYEKCQPIKNISDEKMVNVNSSLHWGQKYEPLTVMIYEKKYNTKVEDFGCIQHPKYKFIGASPDGIIVNKESDRYGRMLEIKNVVSREINGVPKKEYWTQMQLQMEVCDLNDCDFLETKFIEYENRDAFIADTLENTSLNVCLSKDEKIKGEIMYFHTKEGKPFYLYKPLDYLNNTDIENWEDTAVDTYENEPYNYTYMKTIFWKLEVFSCVLILREKEWFKNSIGELANIWKIIEEERVTGYEHRAPNRKQKKDIAKPFIEKESQGCLLKFNNIIQMNK